MPLCGTRFYYLKIFIFIFSTTKHFHIKIYFPTEIKFAEGCYGTWGGRDFWGYDINESKVWVHNRSISHLMGLFHLLIYSVWLYWLVYQISFWYVYAYICMFANFGMCVWLRLFQEHWMCSIIPEKGSNVIYGSYQYIYNAIKSEQLPLWEPVTTHHILCQRLQL